MRPCILLIGLRGSGKSTVGRRAAAALGRDFIDLDDRTLARFEERTVAEVFARRGEAAWREAEAHALKSALREAGAIIALGGGTPCVARARRAIETARAGGGAIVVHLDPPLDDLVRRLEQAPGDRPRLAGAATVAEEARRLHAERAPTFAAIADSVTSGNLDDVVELVVRVAREAADVEGRS